MLYRQCTKKLQHLINHWPSVVLLGTRQIGKTTLALEIEEQRTKSIYLDLESVDDVTKLKNPVTFCKRHQDQLIILDEIQRTPELFPSLRGIIDYNRRQNRRTSQFLMLGSASMQLLKQSSESLAGRITFLEMYGINLMEANNDAIKLWLRGGFPESYLASSELYAFGWLEDLVKSYLERDIVQFGFNIPATRLRRLWTMLSHLQGETINASKLGANLEVSHKTIGFYVDLLTDLFLLRRLEPWHENVKKRLVKSPRIYVRDSGILHHLLNINSYDKLISHPILGKSWEGFVIENIMSVIPYTARPYFYRSAAGAEIDLILTMPDQELWAIEIKFGTAPTLSKGFHIACEDIKATKKYVVYSGDDEYPIQNDVWVTSLHKIMEKIHKITLQSYGIE